MHLSLILPELQLIPIELLLMIQMELQPVQKF